MSSIALDALDVERWKRVESVLDAALELAPDAVPAYLDLQCGLDTRLRRDVEALLEADRRAIGFMAVPAAAMVGAFDALGDALGDALSDDPTHDPATGAPARGGGASAGSPLALEPPPPQRLGRYRVLGELGRGGMGIVYLGRDETLGRPVAIKALPGAVASDPDRLARFLREARSLGTLHHPNIAGIHGIEQARGRRYLILELIDGETLSQRLRAARLPMREALDVCAQVAEALSAAHAQGIVHRDLKPGNIMLTPGGLVKVLDFGLAIHVSQRDAADGTPFRPHAEDDSTLTGTRLGTPGYMSPEQILGHPQNARTDLFAFGAVLYQCLTGTRAFAGTSAYTVIAATLHAPPDLTRLPADTTEPVRALLAQALEKQPARRWADALMAASVLGEARASLDPAAALPLPRAWGADGARLPIAATAFVGREREIEAALGLLERARLVTLTGAGGCGKTRLAIEIARAAGAGLAAELWFADLAPALDAEALSAAIAAAVEVREPAESEWVEVLSRRLQGRTAMLVLDGCDRLPGAVASFAALLLAGCPGLRILATSREWLGVTGEQTLRVPPLSLPDADAVPTPAMVLAAESGRLFVACAMLARGGFELSVENAGIVAAVCRDLDGVPLAIELTAALLRRDRLETIAADIERRLRMDAPPADADALFGAIQLSYDRLAEDERHCFRALSAFTGGWSLEAAAAVCGTDADEFGTLDLLTRLADKSLVAIQRAERIEPRYRFLEPIRHFATTRCEAAGEAAALRGRHVEWFLATAERSAPALLSGADQARCLAGIEMDHPNLLAALRGCESVDAGADMALRIAGAIWLFWYVRGHFARGREALARALALPGADAPTPARAQALFAAGGLAVFQGDYAAGRDLSRAAQDLYEALGDRFGVARSLSHLALCEGGDGHYAEAGARYQEAIRIFREFGDPRRLSAALNNLGVLRRQLGDYAAALVCHDEALELIRRADDRDGELVTRVNLGLASSRLGDDARAARCLDEALRLGTELRAKRASAAALEVTAEVLVGRGEPERAALLFGAARALRSALAMSTDEWWRRMQAELDARLEAGLGSEGFRRCVSEGGERPFERALADARLWLSRDGRSDASNPSAGGIGTDDGHATKRDFPGAEGGWS